MAGAGAQHAQTTASGDCSAAVAEAVAHRSVHHGREGLAVFLLCFLCLAWWVLRSWIQKQKALKVCESQTRQRGPRLSGISIVGFPALEVAG
jgi:ABC-type Fe3+ transport system permease subunit